MIFIYNKNNYSIMFKNFSNFINESSGLNKPTPKFPTDKAANYNYLMFILEQAGLDPSSLSETEEDEDTEISRDYRFLDFCFEKCSNTIVFPKNREIDIDPRQKNMYENFIFEDSIFKIPAIYDYKNDFADHIEKKILFKKRMTELLKLRGASKKEINDFEESSDKHVNFGPADYSWINPALDIIHDEFKEHYINGELRVFMADDSINEDYTEYDYPHKYGYGDTIRPNGVLILSELEKWLHDKYDLQDDKLYDFIIHNQYIEGRYWERLWSFPTEEDNRLILKKSNFGKYGMEPTETITFILNLLQKEFEIKGNNYEGLPVFVDYFKRITFRD